MNNSVAWGISVRLVKGLLRVNNPKGQLEVKWGEGTGESCRFNYQLPRRIAWG
ncbi:Uncharacterised protein [Serratia fonticola]|uniref:PapC-like C-terminal domain-containing protein n=1 Tax=Serratia fonticola TaxID=47917 RepID=A0A4V6KPB4_SERFO|nr:Uncharacterised protein [Serratia fonticola]